MMFSCVCQARRSRRCISSKGSREEAATTKQLLFLAASNRMSFQASGFDSPIVTGYGPCHCVCLFLGTSVQEIEVLTQVGSEDLFPDTSSLLVWWIRLILPRRKKVLSKIMFSCVCQARRSRRCISSKGSREEAATIYKAVVVSCGK